MSETLFHPACCGPCEDCAEYRQQFCTSEVPADPREAADRLYWSGSFPKAPTREQLDAHVKRYGYDCVADIARAYGLERPKGEDEKAQAAQSLRSKGKTVKEIARYLGAPEAVARRYLATQTSTG